MLSPKRNKKSVGKAAKAAKRKALSKKIYDAAQIEAKYRISQPLAPTPKPRKK